MPLKPWTLVRSHRSGRGVVGGALDDRQAVDDGVPRRIEEERERQPVGAAGVADPVRRRPVAAAGQPLEHVAEVAHEPVRAGAGVDPAAAGRTCEPAVVVLGEDREQAVVGVLGRRPSRSSAAVGGG